MKRLIFFLLLAGSTLLGSAQFIGKLVYEVTTTSNINKLTMVCYLDKSHARIEAVSVPLKAGVPDPSNPHYQDTLLFDLTSGKQTTLQYKTHIAVITAYTSRILMEAGMYKEGDVTVENMGAETVNGYKCTHFVLTMTKTKSKRDFWITKDLGAASLVVAGGYLYYPPGHPFLQKLSDAGGAGVMVRAVAGGGAIFSTLNLVSVDKKAPAASLFQVPSWYTTLDRSNGAIPQATQ
jgi:hypothetical protein